MNTVGNAQLKHIKHVFEQRPGSPPLILPGLVSSPLVHFARQYLCHVMSSLQDCTKSFCMYTCTEDCEYVFSDSKVCVDFWVKVMFIRYPFVTHRWRCAVSCVVSPKLCVHPEVEISRWANHFYPRSNMAEKEAWCHTCNLSGEDHYHNNTYLSCWLLIMTHRL